MTHTQNPTTTRPAPLTRSPIRAADTIRERHYQPMQIHPSATQPAKSDLSTHLGITIRWWAPPTSYLPVANDSAATVRLADVDNCRLAVAVAAAVRRGGGVAC
jgi:hypothetical protein